MDVDAGGMTPGNLAGSADQVQLHARMGGSRNRPLSNGFPCLMRIPSTSSGEVRFGFSADVTTTKSPTGAGIIPVPVEMLSPRPAYNDCLSSIGLPGEESATFIPLIIEPYEPALSTAPIITEEPDASALTTITEITTEASNAESPPSPLTPPTAPTQPSNSPELSATSASAVKTPSLTATSTSPTIMPRPPPGSAIQRVNSCRRNLVRQTSPA
ncbi:hypothetical protein Vretimale_17627, partial [Volvox reticuliferus]